MYGDNTRGQVCTILIDIFRPDSQLDLHVDPSDYTSGWRSRSGSTCSMSGTAPVARLLADLQVAVDRVSDKDRLRHLLPRDQLDFLRDWLFAEDYYLLVS